MHRQSSSTGGRSDAHHVAWLARGLLAVLAWMPGTAARGGDLLGGLIHFETRPPMIEGEVAGESGMPADRVGGSESDFHAGSMPRPSSSESFLLPTDWLRIDAWRDDPNDPHRHRGLGQPLVGTSWLNRPWHAGWFLGGMEGDALIRGREDQLSDVFGGYRVGWDWSHYWGAEARLAFARPDLYDSMSQEFPRISRDWFADASVLYYPWGDARWRPYGSAGLGMATFRFRDEDGVRFEESLLHVPVSVGLKYLVGEWMVLRLDVTDNLALGSSGLDTMHNLTYTFGVEAHFGRGTSRRYFPY